MLTATKAIESSSAGKKPDWNAIQRAVAASEPPRLNDIPAHCKFLQKYSGGKNNKYLMDMLAYLDLAMPEGRIVSGWFLDKLGSLKLAPAELIPRIAHACVIAQACGDKERENCGITIGETNVKSLTTSCKADALKGEKIIENAYSMLENTEMSGTNEEVKAIGEFQHELILFIFDLSDKYESLDGVMESFVKKWLALVMSAVSQLHRRPRLRLPRRAPCTTRPMATMQVARLL